MHQKIRPVLAPSILGLQPAGVEKLGDTLLSEGLLKHSEDAVEPVIGVPLLNNRYNPERDAATKCLNPGLIKDFSLSLAATISEQLDMDRFPLVLGGDCSILLGIMPALKRRGNYGLVFLDAHADFYLPHQSVTGEVADMDLAMVTGHGPDILTNILGLKPYVEEKNVIHIGQRDEEEAARYGSADIRLSGIHCYSLAMIKEQGLQQTMTAIAAQVNAWPLDGYWLHFDTDVLRDEDNPAVDYRLPGGLTFAEVAYIQEILLHTGRITGISVSIYNPALDKGKNVARQLVQLLNHVLLQE
jgi:arginase